MLDQFLRKIGVKKYDDLNAEEKETYREWEASLAGRRVTEDDYRKFLESELSGAISRLTDVDLKREASAFRKAEVRIIQKILSFMDMPKVEKQMLENQLESRIKN